MEKKRSTGILVILLLTFPLVCFGQDATNKASSQYEKQPTQNRESIENILAKAKNLDPIQYEVIDVISVTPEKIKVLWNKATTKTWRRLPYIRLEFIMEGEKNKTMVWIERPDGIYVYDSSKGDKYRKMPAIKTIDDITPIKAILNEIEASKTLKELGTEVVDEKLTTIIEFDYIDRGFLIRRKVWICNEKGIPLKIESAETEESAGVIYTMKSEFKNFKFEDIPDTVFEVPENKIVEELPVPK